MLDDLRRVDTDLAHASEERERLGNRIADLDREISAQERLLAEALARRDTRRSYLTYRVREQYKDGPDPALRRLASRGPSDLRRAGARTAAYLSDRDARWVVLYRLETERIDAERAQLAARREEHANRRAEADAAERRLAAVRQARERLLERIRDDRATRDAAIAELERAARELSERVDVLGSGSGAGTLDVRKFRGLLDWPAEGKVGAGFGDRIHPRFGTTVPHPGIDIHAPTGSEIRSVFEGRVVYAAWMRGYGLTAIVDHGGGVLTIHAHAAVLAVEPGETVAAGQAIGRIGDTGSLSGPYLYFEIRDAGEPVDPTEWLRPR